MTMAPAARSRATSVASRARLEALERRRARRRIHAGDEDVVLHQHRDAVQRPAPPSRRELLVGAPRGIERIGRDLANRIELGPGVVQRFDAFEIPADGLAH